MRRIAFLLAAFLALLAGALPAAAHTRSESHSTWLVDGAAVHLTFSVSDVEALRITRTHPPSDKALIAYLSAPAGGPTGAGPRRPPGSSSAPGRSPG